MIHTYTVTGMTCNNCKNKVEDILSKVDGVNSVTVDLNTQKVNLDLQQYISAEELQLALPDKYHISVRETNNVFSSADSNFEPKSELIQLKPLFIIFGYILVASVMLNYSDWEWSNAMLDFMGLFYIIFSFFKLLDLKGFPESFKMYDPLAKTIPVYGIIYPFIEITLGLMFLMRIKIDIALVATLIILGITTVGVTQVLLNKKKIQCACLGTVLKLPMTKATLIENSIMILMATTMLLKTYN